MLASAAVVQAFPQASITFMSSLRVPLWRPPCAQVGSATSEFALAATERHPVVLQLLRSAGTASAECIAVTSSGDAPEGRAVSGTIKSRGQVPAVASDACGTWYSRTHNHILPDRGAPLGVGSGGFVVLAWQARLLDMLPVCVSCQRYVGL